MQHFKSLVASAKTEQEIAAEVAGKHGANIENVTRLAKDQRFSIEDLAKAQKRASQENNFQQARDLKVAIDVRKQKQKLNDAEQKDWKDLLKSTKEVINGVSKEDKKAILEQEKRNNQRARARNNNVKNQKEAYKKLISERDAFLKRISSEGLDEVAMVEAQRDEQLKKVEEFHKKGVLTEQQAADARVKINNDANNKITQSYTNRFTSVLDSVSGFVGQLAQIQQMASQAELTNLENRQTKEAEALTAKFEAEKLDLENTVQTRTERNNALAALETRQAEEAKKLEEKQNRDKVKLQRKAAKQQKELTIYQTLLDIPKAAISAYRSLAGIPIVGPALGAAAAAAATALGLKKLQLIRKQPLPKLQTGGIVEPVSGGRQVIVGEGGVPEGVIPLDQTTLTRLGKEIASGINRASGDTGTITPLGGQKVIVDVNGVQFDGYIRGTVKEAIQNRDIVIETENLSTVS